VNFWFVGFIVLSWCLVGMAVFMGYFLVVSSGLLGVRFPLGASEDRSGMRTGATPRVLID
jgi:hypothetical protein